LPLIRTFKIYLPFPCCHWYYHSRFISLFYVVSNLSLIWLFKIYLPLLLLIQQSDDLPLIYFTDIRNGKVMLMQSSNTNKRKWLYKYIYVVTSFLLQIAKKVVYQRHCKLFFQVHFVTDIIIQDLSPFSMLSVTCHWYDYSRFISL
jgi:hypothetical protein